MLVSLLGFVLAASCVASCTTPKPEEVFASRASGASGTAGSGAAGTGRAGTSGTSGRNGTSGESGNDGDSSVEESPLAGNDAAASDADIMDASMPPPPPDAIRQCGERPVVSTSSFTRRALREAAAECAIFHYCEAENALAWLEDSVARYEGEPTDEHLGDARTKWRAAMESWAKVELFQLGPLASPIPTAGKDTFQGKSFRDRVYSWPNVSRCRVEEQLATQSYAGNGFDRVLISARGLYALEYLLFYEGEDSKCAPSSSAAETLASLGSEALAERKRSYAGALAKDVLELTQGLSTSWSPSGDDFREVFVSASGYPDEQEAMNVLGWALMYVDKELKDYKLGAPLGFAMNAPVSEAESPYAGLGTEILRGNLRGFRALFQGCGADGEGLGFDDWLMSAGHESLSEDIVSAWQNAQAHLDALGPLHQQSNAQLTATYEAVRSLTALLKAELVGPGSVLNLELPASLEGDTD